MFRISEKTLEGLGSLYPHKKDEIHNNIIDTMMEENEAFFRFMTTLIFSTSCTTRECEARLRDFGIFYVLIKREEGKRLLEKEIKV